MRLQAYLEVAKLNFFKLHLVLNLIIENMIQCTPLNVITDNYHSVNVSSPLLVAIRYFI
jgi:hypothetical protein